MNILCYLGLHNFTIWYADKLNSKKDYRRCIWCRKQETRKAI